MLRVDINLLFTVINLLVLFVAMKIFLFKPIQKIIDERQRLADEQFNEAAAKQKAADDMKEQLEISKSKVEEERKQVIADARRSTDEECQRLLKNARKEAEEIKKDAISEAENKKAQIIKKAEQEIADMVIDAAVKVVGEKKGADVDSALYDKFLDKAGDEA